MNSYVQKRYSYAYLFQGLPSIQEATSVQSKSPEPTTNISIKSNSQLDHTSGSGGRESPSTATSTAKSSRRDSLSDKVVVPTQHQAAAAAASEAAQQQSKFSSLHLIFSVLMILV